MFYLKNWRFNKIPLLLEQIAKGILEFLADFGENS
jgi:hypothetical protein